MGDDLAAVLDRQRSEVSVVGEVAAGPERRERPPSTSRCRAVGGSNRMLAGWGKPGVRAIQRMVDGQWRRERSHPVQVGRLDA